jgi:uncharacterized protein YecT (DUF1311 family)
MSLLLAIAMLAAAQDESEIDCANAMAQIEMNICAGRAFERADAELNTLWREVISHARDNDRSGENGAMEGDDRTEEGTLREAQRAWVTFRDAHCTWEGFSERGGSMEPMVYEECRERLTRARIAELSGDETP